MIPRDQDVPRQLTAPGARGRRTRVAALLLLAAVGVLAAAAAAYSLPFLGSALWYPFAPFLLVAALAVLVCVVVLALAVVAHARAREEMRDERG